MTPASEAVTRPNGKVYRRRKGLRQVGWQNDAFGGVEDYVAVLGTHDIAKAREFARPYVASHLVEPHREWVRKMIQNGEETFTFDPVRGAAAVVFRESDDPEVAA